MLDWSKMSPAEIFEALKSAPKVAGPWTVERDAGGRLLAPVRRSYYGATIAWEISDCVEILEWVIPDSRKPPFSNVRCSDRADADARLRELGWLLVDDPEGTST